MTHAHVAAPCKCGAPKLPGQGQRYCADCKELAQWRRVRKRSTRVVRERHPCEDCGGIKEPGHGRRVCVKCKAKRNEAKRLRRKAKRRYCCRFCGTETGIPWATCERCHRYFVAKRRARMKVYRAEWKRRHRRRVAKQARENRRIDYRLRREREGQPVKRRPPGGYVRNDHELLQISAAPLVPHIERRLTDTTIGALGEVARVAPTKLESVVRGKEATIGLGAADRLCVALGIPFAAVYQSEAA